MSLADLSRGWPGGSNTGSDTDSDFGCSATGGRASSSGAAASVDVCAASRRVMEKVGFTYEGDIEHAGLPHVLYRHSR